MNTKLTGQFILAIAISFFFIACGSNDNKGDKTTDTATAAKTDSVKPVEASVPDAVKAAPNLYKVLADTMGIRVLEATYMPGDSSVMHSHPDYALYVIDGGAAEFTGKDGTKMVSNMKSGMENIRGAEVHSVKNIGKTSVKVLMVETTRPQGTGAANPLDATKVAANRYKLIKDSLGLRIIEATYKPGESSVMHSHPDLALYVISGGGNTEFTGKDGKKNLMQMKPGMAAITPTTAHSVKNMSKETTKVLLVEVNRPEK
ncbi:MAG TPA: cupin domain-containing protein [Puia sp.]|jgi:quercetin dioxygenase-like cupin family protein|nr:cupin domain-containing protein [Puia sp.]